MKNQKINITRQENIFCSWCGKLITKEQADKYEGCCCEEHKSCQIEADEMCSFDF